MKAQFVSENVRFERGRDPKNAMGVGIKESIRAWLSKVYGSFQFTEGEYYKINDDNSITIHGDFEVPDYKIVRFPDYIRFKECKGDFMVDYCNLESLIGCPESVGGFFSCEANNLMTLE